MIFYIIRRFFSVPVIYVLFGACILILLMQSFVQTTIISEKRISLLLFLLMFGLIVKNSFKTFPITQIAFTLIGYVSFISIIDLGFCTELYSHIFSLFFWAIVLAQIGNMKIDNITLFYIACIMSLCCNIMSYLYIYQIFPEIEFMQDDNLRIASLNSIYYILHLIPFIFLFKNKLLKILSLIIPIYAIIISEKSTCIICLCVIMLYVFYHILKKYTLHVTMLIPIMLPVILYNDFISKKSSELYSLIKVDLDSGGNGRWELFANTINMFLDSDVVSIIFGHGVDSVSKALGLGAHNDFFEMLYCYGLIGLILMLYFWFVLYKMTQRISNGNLRLSYSISLIVLLFSMSFSKIFLTQLGMFPIAILIGTIYSHNKYSQSTQMLLKKML